MIRAVWYCGPVAHCSYSRYDFPSNYAWHIWYWTFVIFPTISHDKYFQYWSLSHAKILYSCKLHKYITILCRANSRLALSQWETSLQSNAVSHWLGANLESAQLCLPTTTESNDIGGSNDVDAATTVWTLTEGTLWTRMCLTYYSWIHRPQCHRKRFARCFLKHILIVLFRFTEVHC